MSPMPTSKSCAAAHDLKPGMGRATRLTVAMILLHQVIQIVHLPDDHRRAVRLVVSQSGRGIGLTAINGDRLRHAVPTDGFGEETRGCRLVPLRRQQKINRLAVLIHGAIQVRPLAFDPNVRLVDAAS